MKKTSVKKSASAKKDKGMETSIAVFLKDAEKVYLPGISIDTVIFGFHNGNLKVLLIRYGAVPYFNLPGGFVEKKESLDGAALRILKERTGLKNVYLEQFYTSGSTERSQKHTVKELLKKLDRNLSASSWFEQRFISVCYYALIDETTVSIHIEELISEYQWCDVNKLPRLYLDHKIIIQKALERLQMDLDQKLVGFNLMNATFTMGELQKLYEAIYQKQLDRTNFQRKMLSMNILERLEKKYTGKAYKSPYLYRFNRKDKTTG